MFALQVLKSSSLRITLRTSMFPKNLLKEMECLPRQIVLCELKEQDNL